MLVNIRYALRSFGKNPVLAAIAVLSLSLGIGANTAIFSLIDHVLLRSLPVKDPEQLVQLAARGHHYGSNWGLNAMSYPMYRDFRDKAEVFQGVLCRRETALNLGYGGRTEQVTGEMVSGNYFEVLGVGAAIGRTFTPDDDRKIGAHPEAVLGYDFWQSYFAGDASIVGKDVYINSIPMMVMGVSARGFQGIEVGRSMKVYVPVSMHDRLFPNMAEFQGMEDRRMRWVNVFARLKPGVSIQQANAGVEPLYKQIIRAEVEEPGFSKATEYARRRFLDSRMEVFSGSNGRSALRRQITTPLYVLLALTALVLLIACANVANLLIARATARQKEIAVRLALGARRGQIAAQLFAEGAVLAVASSTLGCVVAMWVVSLLLGFLSEQVVSLSLAGSLDLRMLAFTMSLGFLTTLLFGLLPTFQASNPEVGVTLKNEAGSVVGGHGNARFRKALVVAQVALSVLLLVASGLFVRSLTNLRNVDPGFRADRLITFAVNPPGNGYQAERNFQFQAQLLDSLRAIPGASGAGFAIIRILDRDEWDTSVAVEGYQAKPGENVAPFFNAISPGYFDTLGLPFVSGRDFRPGDTKTTPKAAS